MSIFNKKSVVKNDSAEYLMSQEKGTLKKHENVYAIFDTVAGVFNMPFVLPDDGTCKRSFADSVRSGAGNLSRYPKEFILFRIGSYDAVSAHLTSHTPILIAKAEDFIIRRPQSDQPDSSMLADHEGSAPILPETSSIQSTKKGE